MTDRSTLGEALAERGVSRRRLLQFCSSVAAWLALPGGSVRAMAAAMEKARRPSVIWLSLQECTGCTESLTRASSPSVEDLILELISLDYHHTLQAASGHVAEAAREQAMVDNRGQYILLVDGSIPLGNPGYSTIAGVDNRRLLEQTAAGAAMVIAVGTCAAFGGLPMANPNPTGAVPVNHLIHDKPLVNLPGCPPIAAVITAVLAHFLTFGRLPALDDLRRPRAFYGETIHDRCYRRPFYERGLFAETFDDVGARQGWCLFKLGCKGPTTYNACATLKWNGGVSFPIQSGHGCLGCSEARFWDHGCFYAPLSTPILTAGAPAGVALVAGAALGAGMAAQARQARAVARQTHCPITSGDLEGTS